VPEGPDPQATAAAAKNFCKIYQGAGLPCSIDNGVVTADGTEVAITAQFDQLEERLGVTTFKGTVTLKAPDQTWVTRMSGYGSGRDEAIQRGMHEWALLSATAVSDAMRHDNTRPALRAVEPTIGFEVGLANGTAVWRGWTLQRPPLEGGLNHTELTSRFAPVLTKLGPGPHMIRIESARNLGELVLTCYVDGVQAADVCEAVRGYHWPDVGGYEVRQAYAVFGAPVEAPPEPAPTDEPADTP
jgi:hypothetical protein